MTDVQARIMDANPRRDGDLGHSDPDLSLDHIWDAIARHDRPHSTGGADHVRSGRRHRLVRTAAITVGVLAALTGTALGAGSALGIIDLGGGVSATQVTTLPVWNGTTGTFDSGTANGQYIYELAGLGVGVFACGGNTPDVAAFLTSNQPLTQADLEDLLDPSAPLGLVSLAQQKSLGVINEEGGCFPPSVAGPLGTPETPAQRAAAVAFTQQITQEAQAQGSENARSVVVHAPRLRYVTVIHDGKRTILSLSKPKSK